MKILLNNEQTTKKSVFSDITNNEKYNKLENSIFFNQETRSNEISLQELKDLLENNDLLNYPYDFLSLDGSKNIVPALIKINLVDNINIKNSEILFEHYNRESGEITITEKLLFNEQILPSTFPEYLYASVGQSKLLMFAILHEIGHAIHHQLFLKQDNNSLTPSEDFNTNDFLNLISNNGIYLLEKNEETKKYDINHAITYAIKEGFADLYACISLTQIYPKEVSLSFIHEIIESRKSGQDNYYTTETLMEYKQDLENNENSINNFIDLHQYIENKISNTALKLMLEKLSSNNEEQIKHNNAFAGFLKSIIEKSVNQKLIDSNPLQDCDSINEVINLLNLNNNFFNITLENLQENKDIFNYSYELTNKSIQNLKESNFLTSKLMGNVCENVEILLNLDLIKSKINQVKNIVNNKSDLNKNFKIKP